MSNHASFFNNSGHFFLYVKAIAKNNAANNVLKEAEYNEGNVKKVNIVNNGNKLHNIAWDIIKRFPLEGSSIFRKKY